MTSMMVSSCSLLGNKTKSIDIVSKPLERTFVQPVMPREIDLKEPMWYVVTPDNFEEFKQRIIDQEGELVFLAMSVPDYEVMAYNMQELKRYITEMKDVVVYYKKITSPTSEVKEENNRERPSIGLFPRDKTKE